MSPAALPSAGPIAAYRRYWLPELAALSALSLAAIVVFAAGRLDIAAARLFYRPELADPWPVASRPLWHLFYKSAPWVTGSLAAAGVALLVAGAVRRATGQLRLYGVFIMLCVILGPGLIVNGILKDEFLLDATFPDFATAHRAVHEAIETYNTMRPHTSIGYQTPARRYAA